eukprot:Nitzschia sp. Nitz4//scaffold33_size148984//111651//114677//NITZ4_002942-RA/size148984-processed-gene-0.177-mRNA-1//-1//CDS//3329548469//4091//frame0
MSKSSKKRRQKRKRELERLRGVSLLDVASPPEISNLPSPSPGITKQEPTSSSNNLPKQSSTVQRVDFVFPKASGRGAFAFQEKHTLVDPLEESKKLPTIAEDGTSESKSNGSESIDDILFPNRKRKLADKFEAIHEAEQSKAVAVSESSNNKESDTTKESKSSKKKKSNKSNNGDNSESKATVPQDHAIRAQMELVHRQISGRSVEEAVKDKPGLRPRANSTDGELNLPQRGLCDEQMVLQAHKWKDEHVYVHQVIPRGLSNLGNTCFLNSILQCLAYLPPLFQSLVSINESIAKQKQNHKKLSQGQKITASMCALFHKVHGVGRRGDNAIAPEAIVKALPTLASCGSRNGYKFRPGRQEDAHEFLVHLLDAMHDGELRAAGINQHISGWRDRLPATRLDETTFVHRIFGGYFRSQVKCPSCSFRSNTYDPFLDLSLEVSKKSSNSVLYALQEFTRKEKLDADNQWKCSGCKKYVCPTKQLTVFRPPLSLCIQLKRFAFGGGLNGRVFSSFGAGGGWKQYGKNNASFRGGSKITKPIEFPADLNVPLSDGRSCAYSLTGVVVHVGGSASSGHYTAYIRTPGRKGQAQWYHADDSFVEPVSEKTVLRQKDAYILFYCRKEVKLEFPQPPPRGMSADEAVEFARVRARARANSNASHEAEKTSTAKKSTGSSTLLQPQLSPQSTGGSVTLTKTTVHPLADMWNKTMAAQFKNKEEMPPTPPAKESDVVNSDESDSESESSEQASTSGSKEQEQDTATKSAPLSPQAGQEDARDGSSDDSGSESSGAENNATKPLENGDANASPSSAKSKSNGVSNDLGDTKKPTEKTRVVMGSSDSRGTVKVMLGPRKRKPWMSKFAKGDAKGAGFQLLGNLGVSRWDDGDDSLPKAQAAPKEEERSKIVKNMEKSEKSRKRKMHLDRWDALLDQGKTKKVKKEQSPVASTGSQEPKKNMFQRLQSGIQKMNRGKAKGMFRRDKDGKGGKRRKR